MTKPRSGNLSIIPAMNAQALTKALGGSWHGFLRHRSLPGP